MYDNKEHIGEVISLLETDFSRFKDEFMDLHPFDQANIIVELEDEKLKQIISVLTPEKVSEFFEYIEKEDSNEILEMMSVKFASKVFEEMAVDDATDIFKSMKPERRKKYLTEMDLNDVEQIRYLMKYQEDTAGSLMTTEYIYVDVEMTVAKAMKQLLSNAREAETIYYIYVVNQKDVLQGVLSLKELILAKKDELIADIMTDEVISVHVLTDQEDVAYMVKDYDLGAIPVVDNRNRLLGIITVDDVLDVLEEEKDEDYAKLAALSDSEFDLQTETVLDSIKSRLPWLLILLVVGGFTSILLAQFEDTLKVEPVLTFFLPLILAMAGNTGTQSLAVTVRALSTNQFEERKDTFVHLLREIKTGFLNGSFVGVLVFLFVFLAFNQFYIALVVAASLLVALTVATLSGALIPIIMNYFKIDPAVAAGPFITTINDIIAVTVYLLLATRYIL